MRIIDRSPGHADILSTNEVRVPIQRLDNANAARAEAHARTCVQCNTTSTSQWRTTVDTNEWLCSRCGLKHRRKHKAADSLRKHRELKRAKLDNTKLGTTAGPSTDPVLSVKHTAHGSAPVNVSDGASARSEMGERPSIQLILCSTEGMVETTSELSERQLEDIAGHAGMLVSRLRLSNAWDRLQRFKTITISDSKFAKIQAQLVSPVRRYHR